MLDRPSFVDSAYFVPEPNNWHLKPGAPKEIVEEFNEYMEALKKWEISNER